MKINFTQKDIDDITSIIKKYRNISSSLIDYQRKADDIREKVVVLEKEMETIKENEIELMTILHQKYGEFSLQDVYDVVYDKL